MTTPSWTALSLPHLHNLLALRCPQPLTSGCTALRPQFEHLSSIWFASSPPGRLGNTLRTAAIILSVPHFTFQQHDSDKSKSEGSSAIESTPSAHPLQLRHDSRRGHAARRQTIFHHLLDDAWNDTRTLPALRRCTIFHHHSFILF